MTKRSITAQSILWLFILFQGLLTGGALFDALVLTPLWAGSPPQSVTTWSYGVIQGKFFVPIGTVGALFSLVLLFTARLTPPQCRRWAVIAAVCGLIVLLSELLFFIPIQMKIQATPGTGLSSEEIVNLANRFVLWHWLKLAVGLTALAAGLQALAKFNSPDDGRLHSQ
jgi:hypothetical protein